MTVTYSQQISTTSFCLFARLLMSRWKGGVWKLIWKDLLLYLVLYTSCSVTYRFFLDEAQKRIFEKVALLFESYRNAAPISFILGFYVSIVVARWWEQYMLIPWPDDMCILVAALVQGKDCRSKAFRRDIARYINLAFVLSFSRISAKVLRSFPDYESLVKKDYLTKREKAILDMIDEANNHHLVWDPLPLLWASLTVVKARKEGYVPDDHSQEVLIHEITNLRYSCSKIQEYNNMSVPLVYTQVTTMALYSYFVCSAIGQQYLDPEQGYKSHHIDLYVPIFMILQFVFYMGWLKVAESLLNPFGDDDDDFDTTDLLERHLEVSYLIVDGMHVKIPNLLQDLDDTAGFHEHNNTHSHFDLSKSYNSFANFNPPPPPFPVVTAQPIKQRQYLDPTQTVERLQSDFAMTSHKTVERPNFETSRTVEIDTHEAPIRSSQESFCSTATAIPNSNLIRHRSQSLDRISDSSSNCSYDSCLSMMKQNSRNNSIKAGSFSSTLPKKFVYTVQSASFDQVGLTTTL